MDSKKLNSLSDFELNQNFSKIFRKISDMATLLNLLRMHASKSCL